MRVACHAAPIFVVLLGMFIMLAGSAAAQRHYDDYAIAVLQGLEKPHARVQTFEVPVGQVGSFGTLQVLVRACRKTPPEDKPEAVAYLEISDSQGADRDKKSLFHGWMFASSPALSALENPIYDVWVLDCKNAETTPTADDAGKTAADSAPPAAKAKRKH